jgi:soluble lytic murein transglycosylase-like protein
MGVLQHFGAKHEGGAQRALLIFAAIFAGFVGAGTVPALAGDDSLVVAVVEPAAPADVAVASGDISLPRFLSPSDAERYRRIFSLQRGGDWRGADAEIAQLQDRLLIGHVMAQRLLHPRLYRASFAELDNWLETYLDHPEATRIYQLALSRKPKAAEAPPRPDGAYLSGLGADLGLLGETPPHQPPELSEAETLKAQKIKARIRAHIRSGWPTGAKALLESDAARGLIGPLETDEIRADIAAAYFAYGKDEQALDLARETAAHARSKVPAADWIAGIAAWRMGDPAVALRHFQAVAQSPYASKWEVSAAAYWAARANLVTRNPAEVSRWLEFAAQHERTFYGILARRALGMEPAFDWNAPALDQTDLDRLGSIPGARRALALLEAGEHHRADAELRKIYATADPDLARSILALALHGDFPGLAMRIGVEVARNSGEIVDAAIYPVPSWKPQQGYTIDRSLLFAVIRQESRFDAGAESYAGARGLMQIMPQTAKFLASYDVDADADESDYELFDPESNIALGQKYLTHLLEDGAVEGNLFMLAAAYNGGPAKVAEWRRKIADAGDPLLFIESIPSRETRGFVERVVANMWIYQQRLGQPSLSLTRWRRARPVYSALDRRDINVAGNDGIETDLHAGPYRRSHRLRHPNRGRRQIGRDAGRMPDRRRP